MNLYRVPIAVGWGVTKVTIGQFTDVHAGHEGHHAELFEQFIRRQVRDPHFYSIGTGDLVDADRPSMRARKAMMYSDRPEALSKEDQKEMDWLDAKIVPKYKRLAPRCLGLLDGDHYTIFANRTTSTQYICRKTGIRYLGERMAFIGLVFCPPTRDKGCRYVILARHGTGGGGSNGADMARLERQNQGFLADLYLGGHTHKQNVTPSVLLYPDKNFERVKSKVVWHVRGGSFLRGFMPGIQTYAERAEYGPLVTGWTETHLTLARRGAGANRVLAVYETSAELIAS